MDGNLLFALAAVISMIPVSLTLFRKDSSRDRVFWILLLVALIGPAAYVENIFFSGWKSSFSTTIWVTIANAMLVYALVVLLDRQAWRLTPLVCPYLALLGVIAIIWSSAPGAEHDLSGIGIWVVVHIVVSVMTYSLVTIAALAALSAFLLERALKRKKPNQLTRKLPSVADSDRLLVRLLVWSEVVLGLGIASGMAAQWKATGDFLMLDHKTILTILAFVVIGALLLVRIKTGLRGQLAARIVLVAYLLMTLGYPGVKFVTDVILA